MTGQHPGWQAAQAAQDAHTAAAAAIQRIARAAGATGHPGQVAAGLQAARRLQLATGSQLLQHLRAARRDGISWHEIGALLSLGPHAAADGLTLAAA
jgi:hypothetical protein